MSHWHRRRLNTTLQRRAAANVAEADKIWVTCGELPYHCFVGTCLVGSDNAHSKIVTGAFLVVTELRGETVCRHDEDNDEPFEVTMSQLAARTRLRWALTLFCPRAEPDRP